MLGHAPAALTRRVTHTLLVGILGQGAGDRRAGRGLLYVPPLREQVDEPDIPASPRGHRLRVHSCGQPGPGRVASLSPLSGQPAAGCFSLRSAPFEGERVRGLI